MSRPSTAERYQPSALAWAGAGASASGLCLVWGRQPDCGPLRVWAARPRSESAVETEGGMDQGSEYGDDWLVWGEPSRWRGWWWM